MVSRILFIITSLCMLSACGKYNDKYGPEDERLDRPFCNDPEAVNYNWDFPGRPDSAACYYPADILAGRYMLVDSIYSASEELDTLGIRTVYFDIYSLTRKKIGLVNLCGPDTLFFLADRFYNVSSDSLFIEGQPFCSPLDTMFGSMRLTVGDSSYLKLDLTVSSGLTGLRHHRGTAVKQ